MTPLQLTVNVNDLLRVANNVRHAGLEFEDDLTDLSLAFQRELNKTERYKRILITKKYGAVNLLEGIAETDLRSLEESFLRIKEYDQKFKEIVAKHPRPRAGQDASLAAKSGASLQRSKSKYSWVAGGKTKAEKTLDRLQCMNSRLKEDLDVLVSEYTKSVPGSFTKIENDPDAQEVGIATTTMLRTIERNERLPDASLNLSPPQIQSLQHGGPGNPLAEGRLLNDYAVLVEYRGYKSSNDEVSERALRLATFLNRPKPPGLNVLTCIGVFNEAEKRRFGFVFDPRALQIITEDGDRKQLQRLFQGFQNLSSSLDAKGMNNIFRYSKFAKPNPESARPICLSQRFRMAYSLARTIHHLHMLGWLHQNIRSENIWFTRSLQRGEDPVDGTWMVGEPYLFSFEYARKTNEYSDAYRIAPQGGSDHNLYRHPDRQDAHSDHYPHTKLHDIYSLGVVLLEIGLGRAAAGMRDYYQTTLLEFSTRRTQHHDPPKQLHPEQIKEGYLHLTRMLLSEKMGGRYASIVMACLTGSFGPSVADGAEAPSLHRIFRLEVVEVLAKLAESVSA